MLKISSHTGSLVMWGAITAPWHSSIHNIFFAESRCGNLCFRTVLLSIECKRRQTLMLMVFTMIGWYVFAG